MEQILKQATLLATRLHEGQVDKSGKPYILHPIRVSESLSDVKCKILAVLHDVLEDCEITADELVEMGIPQELVDRLLLLTKQKGERYFDYIDRVKQDDLTRQVKLADLKDNMDLTRLYPTLDTSRLADDTYLEETLSEKDLKRYRKYQKAKAILEGLIEVGD